MSAGIDCAARWIRGHGSRGLAFSAALALIGCASSSGPRPPFDGQYLPTLVVKIDCGDCRVREDVPALIVESYTARRQQARALEQVGGVAVLTIKVCDERSLVTRFLVGPIGPLFSDSIEAELEFGERRVPLSESARVPFQGIEVVAKRIGEKALDALVR